MDSVSLDEVQLSRTVAYMKMKMCRVIASRDRYPLKGKTRYMWLYIFPAMEGRESVGRHAKPAMRP